jgi:alpha-ketoglutarate-dependent taurine dioxygenase
LAGVKRKPVTSLQKPEGITADSQCSIPLLTCLPAGSDAIEWARQNRELIDLDRDGAILLRGLAIGSAAVFEQFVQSLFGELVEYTNRSTPRSQVSGRIYTSTEYPAHQTIPQHNELSFSHSWPLRISFCCLRPAETGGETPIADSRAVFHAISPAVREPFVEKGVMYVRNYLPGLDLSWQTVFGIESPAEVTKICSQAGIECEWGTGGRLRTTQVNQAIATHPRTGEQVWFNQAHLFHVSALPAPIRAVLTSEFGERNLPRNAYYGDGSPIPENALAEIRQAYVQLQRTFSWNQNDILLLDNMLCAHGRNAFTGRRRVVVGMAQPYAKGAGE